MTFSERLVALRNYRHMTQSSLAEKAKISARAVQNYEITDRIPKGMYLQRLAEALEVPVSALLSDEGYNKFSAQQSSLARLWSDKNEDRKAPRDGMKLVGKTLKLARTLPFPLGLGITLGAGLLAVFNTIEYKKENKEKLLKSLYKELSRCESLALIYNDKIESVRDEYEELALCTQQEDAGIEDYKAFIALTQQLSLYQEYRALLKQKKKYLSLLIAQVEEHPNKKTAMMDELLAEIGELENKEAELNKSVSDIADEDDGE